MAARGRKPKPAHLKAVTGNPGKRPIEPKPDEPTHRTEPLEPMKKLTKRQQAIWDRFINRAWWITEFDVPKAHSYVLLKTREVWTPDKMLEAEKNRIRALETDLCLDIRERERHGITLEDNKDPDEEFFS